MAQQWWMKLTLEDGQNRTGFFIHPDECVACGWCQKEASTNFANSRNPDGSEGYHSTVFKQPDGDDELREVIKVAAYCMVDCVYYGGRDGNIIKRLREAGVAEDCIVHRD